MECKKILGLRRFEKRAPGFLGLFWKGKKILYKKINKKYLKKIQLNLKFVVIWMRNRNTIITLHIETDVPEPKVLSQIRIIF